ncbi:unnamed protein product [Schistosoma mattheei]|uniref:Uncharacterized protein n=1 Tax=Schistosoma mattheei TaxID=31246 RepID=A0AA85BIS5_9TREM|nr:unnamed protein product [Schistosoma mattheei]
MDVTAWELEKIIGSATSEKVKYGKRKAEYSPLEEKNKRLKAENSVSNHEKLSKLQLQSVLLKSASLQQMINKSCHL